MRRILFVGVVLVLSSATVFNQSKPSSTVQGVWRVVEATITGPNARTDSKPQPSLFIFTAKHYSMVRVGAVGPRPNLPADLTKATVAELTAVWGNPAFAANSGTYEVSGSTLTTRPVVAKNPGVMAAGAYTTYSFKLDGNTLSLTDTRNANGPAPNPTTLKLSRVE